MDVTSSQMFVSMNSRLGLAISERPLLNQPFYETPRRPRVLRVDRLYQIGQHKTSRITTQVKPGRFYPDQSTIAGALGECNSGSRMIKFAN
jgi:hypothetical protein